MIIGALKEVGKEKRCALTPEIVVKLLKMGVGSIVVEQGLGLASGLTDAMYVAAGASLADAVRVASSSDILLSINTPSVELIAAQKVSSISICAMNPFFNSAAIAAYVSGKITAFALELVPRSTRGQAMDIMSSQATVAGYKAVLTAAQLLPKFFPMFMTAAGSIKPAKVLVLGAGVAGLQSIATARKLGAVVEAFDVRSAVKEEVVSLGAKFVEVAGATEDKAAGGYAVEQSAAYKALQAQAIHEAAIRADVIIATAQIPGRTAPILIKKETVASMQPGSVIIDLAASTGGNVEGVVNDATVCIDDVTIVGESNLASTMPGDASKMFSRNIYNLLGLMISKVGALQLNFEDDIIKGACVCSDGNIVNDRLKS